MLTFTNSGNVCWFNSALQVTLHIPQIANVLRDDVFPTMLMYKRKNASDFALELSAIAKKYWSSFEHEGSHDATALLNIFVKIHRNFAGKKQYDASEAFLKIVDTLESAFVAKDPCFLPVSCNVDEWKKHAARTNSTFLSDVCMGQTKQTYKGSVTYQHFTGLTIPECSSLEKGIHQYKNDGDFVREFTKLPLVLPILFQKNLNKNFVYYDVTLVLDGREYVLFAVLLHQNNHWVAMAMNAGKWSFFDDDKATRIHDMNVLVQRDAVLLLYKCQNV
jgi:ubiquitin C-terminal hydrolase